MKKMTLILIIGILLVGCKTTRNISPSPILVPTLLSIKDVESAILLALEDTTIKERGLEIKERRTEKRIIDLTDNVRGAVKKERTMKTTDNKHGIIDKKFGSVAVENKALGIAKTEVIVERITNRTRSRHQYWYYEGKRGKDIIYAGYHRKKFYMRIEIKYSEDNLVFTIVDSKNLRQSKRSIHKSALIWLNELERKIRINLGKYDRIKYKQG